MSSMLSKLFSPLTLVVFMGLTFSFSSMASLPENYQSLAADHKREILWEQIVDSKWQTLPAFNDNSWNSILKNISAMIHLNQSFDHTSDEMPVGRVKFIHTFGTVVQFSFISSNDHPFTGIYKEGGIGLARLSLAAAPTSVGYTPGIALKFLIDGRPSQNVIAMYRLEGQQDNWNYFEYPFSNKIPEPTTWTLWALGKIFELVRNPATDLPVSHLASLSQQGISVDAAVAPEQLFFQPSLEVRHRIAPTSREDIRLSLATIPAGTSLYDVYGQYQGKSYFIGKIVTDSEFIASSYGDKNLFFQHKR
ncbi:MAG: hypothetical protein HQK52_04670 [Oligoflexia bacterium]|nr:hypothetical protein [Oligoflexia bacterium]